MPRLISQPDGPYLGAAQSHGDPGTTVAVVVHDELARD